KGVLTLKKEKLPLLPLRGMIVFPSVVLHLDVGREKSIAALETAMLSDQLILLTAQKESSIEKPSSDEIHPIGTAAKINQMLNLPNEAVRMLVEGKYRAESTEFIDDEKGSEVEIRKVRDIHGDHHEEEAVMRQLLMQFEKYINLSKKLSHETLETV